MGAEEGVDCRCQTNLLADGFRLRAVIQRSLVTDISRPKAVGQKLTKLAFNVEEIGLVRGLMRKVRIDRRVRQHLQPDARFRFPI